MKAPFNQLNSVNLFKLKLALHPITKVFIKYLQHNYVLYLMASKGTRKSHK